MKIRDKLRRGDSAQSGVGTAARCHRHSGVPIRRLAFEGIFYCSERTEEDMVAERTKPITGGCMCEAIRYEASEPLIEVYYCHCRACQKAFGNVVGAWTWFRAEALRFTRGEPKFYRSSDVAQRGFCGNCGT